MLVMTRNIKFIIVELLVTSCLPVTLSQNKHCFSTADFLQGYQSSGVLRALNKTGPFTCVRECLLRRNCHSINFYPGEAQCELLYLQQGELVYSTPTPNQLHVEKYQMPSMVNVHPCNESTCDENERCEVLYNNNVICSTTECSPLRIHKSWESGHTHTLAVGSEAKYYCSTDTNQHTSLLRIVKCKPNGVWDITYQSRENIQHCNRYECVRHSGAIYMEKTNGCYIFVNAKKTHREANTYCQSTYTEGHLLFFDRMEKVRAVIENVIPLQMNGDPFVWVDGIYNKSLQNVDTWNGTISLQKLRNVQAYANIVDDEDPGCLNLFPLVNAIAVTDCQSAFSFLCEIDLNFE